MKVLPFLAVATFIAGITMLVVGYRYGGAGGRPTPDAVVTFHATPTAVPSAAATDQPSPTATPVPYDGKVTRFRIPKFSVDVPIEDIGILPNNELATPSDPHDVGWYGIYAKPGFNGNAVFSAHVDYYGLPPADMPFHRLKELKPNDQIVVQMDNGVDYTYSVDDFTRYATSDDPSTADLPQIKMGELIDAAARPAGQQWITLITCGNSGPFKYVSGNSGPVEYLTRDVVIAHRVS